MGLTTLAKIANRRRVRAAGQPSRLERQARDVATGRAGTRDPACIDHHLAAVAGCLHRQRPTTHGMIQPEIVSVIAGVLVALVERAELVAHALDFLVRLTDEDVPLDEALNTLSAFAEQFQ